MPEFLDLTQNLIRKWPTTKGFKPSIFWPKLRNQRPYPLGHMVNIVGSIVATYNNWCGLALEISKINAGVPVLFLCFANWKTETPDHVCFQSLRIEAYAGLELLNQPAHCTCPRHLPFPGFPSGVVPMDPRPKVGPWAFQGWQREACRGSHIMNEKTQNSSSYEPPSVATYGLTTTSSSSCCEYEKLQKVHAKLTLWKNYTWLSQFMHQNKLAFKSHFKAPTALML